jgi:hypothetical protein
MDIQDTSAAIYSEAKSEYTKQLIFNFQPVLLRFFLDRHAEAKVSPTVTSKTKSALSEFQDSLSQIPEWNLDKVQRETTALLQGVHCDYIEDLITAVFIAHTKILSAIRLHSKPRRRIQITVPKPDHFMHRALSECSRLLWSNVYLFSDLVSSLERQKNTNDINRHLEEGILQAIRNLLPVKSILRDSLQDDDDDAIQVTSAPEETNEMPGLPMNKPEDEGKPELNTEGLVEDKSETANVKIDDLSEHTLKSELENVGTPVLSNNLLDISGSRPVLSNSERVPEATGEATGEATSEATGERAEDVKTDLSSQTNQALIIDIDKSVGFTGVDSVFGFRGDAELRPMIEEGSDEFQILGESESLDMDEFEDIDETPASLTPLAAGDYETL